MIEIVTPWRLQVLRAFETRCQAIQRVNGFHTDAGLHVHLGELPGLGPDDPDEAIVIVPGDEQPQDTRDRYTGQQNVLIQLPVLIHAVTKADLAQAVERTELLIADVKRAVELADRTLGMHEHPDIGPLVPFGILRGPVRAFPREAGSQVTGLVAVYIAPIPEIWGWP